MADKRFDLVAFGEPLVELNQTGQTGAYLPGFGGDTSNAAIAAARQGARVGYVTAVGADDFGDRFLDLWRAEGVDTAAVRRDPAAHTGMYFISHGPRGHGFTYMRAGSAASRMTPADLPEDTIASARILHLSGITQAISPGACDAGFAAMEMARRHGVTVSYDSNLRLKLWPIDRARAIIHAALAGADVALLSQEDAEALCGTADAGAILDRYCAMGPKVVVLKVGKEGAWIAAGGERRHIPGHAVAAVDATGAGDTFAGAFLTEVAAGRDPFTAAAYANAAAALSTTGWGAVTPIPHRPAVEAFLAAVP
ncbi:MAG TPA: sugar kinase [Azospirillum sp.]